MKYITKITINKIYNNLIKIINYDDNLTISMFNKNQTLALKSLVLLFNNEDIELNKLIKALESLYFIWELDIEGCIGMETLILMKELISLKEIKGEENEK